MAGLRNHNFIIPHLLRKNKGNMDENDGNRPSCSPADFLPGAPHGFSANVCQAVFYNIALFCFAFFALFCFLFLRYCSL
jgi:hypothetical protein